MYAFKRVSVILAIFIFGLAFAAAGCKKGETTSANAGDSKADPSVSKKTAIGVSLLTLSNPFFKDMGDAMQTQGANKGFDVFVTSGDLDPAKQKDQIKNFIVQKVAAIILTPCDSKSVGTAIADANAAGIPVFTADVAATAEGAKVISHCATDNLEGGRVAGRAVVEALGGHGKVAILDHPEVESAIMRETGFIEVIAQSPGIEIVAKLPCEGARDRSFSATQDLLQSHPEVDMIFAVNDPAALGALAALEKAGKAGTIKIVGFDGQLEARQAVKAGKLYATVMQYPKQIAAVTIDNVAKYLSGESVPGKVLLPPAIYRQAEANADPDVK